jgi:hypothetical protein
MNYNWLNHDEASFILFSFKKTLRDRVGLTPIMVQFYENGVSVLSSKLKRLEDERNGQT